MGGADEIGEKFSGKRILFDKNPINFAIDEPTTLRYIDPILYAHNLSIDLLIDGRVKIGYHPFPDAFSMDIIERWVNFHNENIDQILE